MSALTQKELLLIRKAQYRAEKSKARDVFGSLSEDEFLTLREVREDMKRNDAFIEQHGGDASWRTVQAYLEWREEMES